MREIDCQHDWVYEPYTVSSMIRKICRKCLKEDIEMLEPVTETTEYNGTTLSEFDELINKKRVKT